MILTRIETPRLMLRRWREDDRAPFARMNADPRVMEFFPACLSPEESDAMLDRNEAHFARHGFGFLAAELRETGEFAGFVGMGVPSFDAHFTPCVEIGWRLAVEYWGRGFATEAAREVIRQAEGEIVSFTTERNYRSRRVMEKLGMTRDPGDDFEHPGLPEGHPLRPHVLYRINAG
jgi:RimJ/RimL family protein N-acetyltransferase